MLRPGEHQDGGDLGGVGSIGRAQKAAQAAEITRRWIHRGLLWYWTGSTTSLLLIMQYYVINIIKLLTQSSSIILKDKGSRFYQVIPRCQALLQSHRELEKFSNLSKAAPPGGRQEPNHSPPPLAVSHGAQHLTSTGLWACGTR